MHASLPFSSGLRWETGYFGSMDITHDRAGFYICWGCLEWVPAIYTGPAQYLVNHPVQLGPLLAGSLLLAGLGCIWANYDADRQRQVSQCMPEEGAGRDGAQAKWPAGGR
jgi:hypothetical protein